MSNAPENKWRSSNSQQLQKARDRSSQQALPRTRKPSSDITASSVQVTTSSEFPSPVSQPLSPSQHQPPNAWTGAAAAERSRSASAARLANNAVKSKGVAAGTSGNATVAAGGQQEDMYMPVGGFNGEEIEEFLRKCYQDAVAGDSEGLARWKAAGDAANQKQGGPWGQKPTMMANGSDFWVLLKKQVAAKEQGIGG